MNTENIDIETIQDLARFVVSQTACPHRTSLDHEEYVTVVIHSILDKLKPIGHGYVAKGSKNLVVIEKPTESQKTLPHVFPIFRLEK